MLIEMTDSKMHPLERSLLLALKDQGTINLSTLQDRSGLPISSITRAALWLAAKNYIDVFEEKETHVKLGSEGQQFLEHGFPERRLIQWLIANGGKASIDHVKQHSGLTATEINVGIGWATRKQWLQITRMAEQTTLIGLHDPLKDLDEELVSYIGLEEIPLHTIPQHLQHRLSQVKQRPDILHFTESVKRTFQITSRGTEIAQHVTQPHQELSQLTSEHIKAGTWRQHTLRPYNIHAPVQQTWPGKKQAYKRFLDELKLKLVALGFKEMLGPIVEYAFFNCDALFMPQDHPAREIHDLYYVKTPTPGDLSAFSNYVDQVKITHENGGVTKSQGWQYPFSLEETHRLLLRSQGTALSVRMLVNEALEIPGKYFSISRCFRPDVVDRTHLTEFNQIEGIVVGSTLTFRDLLGILQMFALEIADADQVRFKPDYFPFTEPSVELSAFKKGAGWLEFGGAGMFRKEVTTPLGINVPVIAWGLGVDRLFMMKAGVNDIRELFTSDLTWLRSQKVM
jgi:phenylalanyl-tRNA synthetase alpha chain